MKKLALILSALFLVACEPPPVNKEFERTKVEIVVHTYDNTDEVTDAYNLYVGDKYADDLEREGWATWGREEHTCEIHVVKYAASQEKTWGHELAHCLYGRFHK